MVAPAEQRRVFVRPPAGVRKIVLATNIGEQAFWRRGGAVFVGTKQGCQPWLCALYHCISVRFLFNPGVSLCRQFNQLLVSRLPAAAETAITIDDVVCVVNSGRLKEKSYDPYTNVSTLMVRQF